MLLSERERERMGWGGWGRGGRGWGVWDMQLFVQPSRMSLKTTPVYTHIAQYYASKPLAYSRLHLLTTFFFFNPHEQDSDFCNVVCQTSLLAICPSCMANVLKWILLAKLFFFFFFFCNQMKFYHACHGWTAFSSALENLSWLRITV